MRTRKQIERNAERRAAYSDRKVSRQIDQLTERLRADGLSLGDAKRKAIMQVARGILKGTF